MSSYQCRFLPNYSLPSLHSFVTRIHSIICSQSCTKTDTSTLLSRSLQRSSAHPASCLAGKHLHSRVEKGTPILVLRFPATLLWAARSFLIQTYRCGK